MAERPVAGVELIDLAAVLGTNDGRRVRWARQTEDLNLNVLIMQSGEEVAEHVNSEVDVLLIAVEGEGRVQADGVEYSLRTGQALVIPKGMRRSIRCDGDRFAYLTCHPRRGGLWPKPLSGSKRA